MLVNELQSSHNAIERINQQWRHILLSTRSHARRLSPHNGAELNALITGKQSALVSLEELNDDFLTLKDLITASDSNTRQVTMDYMVIKIYGEITYLASLFERQALRISAELVTQRRINETWLFALFLANVCIMTAIAWKVNDLVIKPTKKLLTAIERFGAGDLSTRSDIQQRDEIGLLADAFNKMASQIVALFSTENELRHQLQSNHEKLVEANRLAKIGHWYWDIPQDNWIWSEEAYQFFDAENPSHANAETRNPLMDGQWISIKNELESCRQHGGSFCVNVNQTVDDEATRYFIIRGHAIQEDERVIALYGTVQDVTELKLRDDALAISEEKYRLAMTAARDGIWDWDIKTNNVELSDEWQKILGPIDTYEHWRKLLHPEDITTVLDSLRSYLAAGSGVWQEEYRIRKSNDDWFWVLARGEIVEHDQYGKPTRMIGMLSNIDSKKEQENIIWQQANFDALTLLPNRKLLTEHMTKDISAAERNGENIWLLFLDLDGFKEINDNLGHDVGDKLLIDVADRLKTNLREADLVARLGGDEFVVVLSRMSGKEAVETVAAHIISFLGEQYRIDDNEVYITASIGIANYPHDASNVTELLQFADQSMYAAKNSGKNKFRYFTQAMQAESQFRVKLAAMMRSAIEQQEFELYYQPIINLRCGEICKAEALIRWRPPGHGMLSPDDFIPIAEETGIICDAGLWVLQEAVKQLAQWKDYDYDLQLSVNLSPIQIKKKNCSFEKWLTEVVNTLDCRDNLVLEITENTLLNNNDDHVNEKLLQFRDLGIRVAIDDFGTGYSSLSYLQKFDIDFLKIDRSFIDHLETDQNQDAICKAIITMAHSLNMQVIAEGVETHRQSEILKNLGCDFAQGFYYCRPLPASEFEKRVFDHVPC